jgi:2-methylcitrate dehydratase PrpD
VVSTDALDPIDDLIANAARLDFDCLPADCVRHQKRRLLDNIACALAGVHAKGADALLELFRSEQSAGQATVLGSGDRLSIRDAAMQNSLMARAWDFCDVISPGYHPSSTDVPVALAVGEYCGSTGRDVLVAMAAGQDVAVRINAAAQSTGFLYNGFDSNILAPISGAIIAGRLLGLSATELREAVGLAINTSAGSFQAVQDKVLAVRLAQANATRNAVESALLARAGFTGIRRILGGELSFFRLFARREPDWSQLTEGLGRQVRGAEVTCFKMYPSCGVTLALTDAALDLKQRYSLASSNIARGRILVSPTMMMLCGQRFVAAHACEVDAMFSAQYVAANALERGASRLEHFTRERICEPCVGELARRLDVSREPSYSHADECELEIETTAGQRYRAKARYGKGWPQNPPTDAEFAAKLQQCLEFSGLPLSVQQRTAIPHEIRDFETIGDIRPFVRALLVCETPA